jgi:hypothetical protein
MGRCEHLRNPLNVLLDQLGADKTGKIDDLRRSDLADLRVGISETFGNDVQCFRFARFGEKGKIPVVYQTEDRHTMGFRSPRLLGQLC